MNPKIDLPQTLRWEGGELYLLDQTLLPGKVVEERQDSVEQVWDSIKKLKVRGAPAIGIAGAYGLVVAMKAHQDSNLKLFSLNCTNRRNIWMAQDRLQSICIGRWIAWYVMLNHFLKIHLRSFGSHYWMRLSGFMMKTVSCVSVWERQASL